MKHLCLGGAFQRKKKAHDELLGLEAQRVVAAVLWHVPSIPGDLGRREGPF